MVLAVAPRLFWTSKGLLLGALTAGVVGLRIGRIGRHGTATKAESVGAPSAPDAPNAPAFSRADHMAVFRFELGIALILVLLEAVVVVMAVVLVSRGELAFGALAGGAGGGSLALTLLRGPGTRARAALKFARRVEAIDRLLDARLEAARSELEEGSRAAAVAEAHAEHEAALARLDADDHDAT